MEAGYRVVGAVIILFLSLKSEARAAVPPNINWAVNVNSSSSDSAYGVATDSSNNIFVTGVTPIGNDDVYVSKYNSAGTQLWEQKFGTTSVDEGMAVATDPVGNVFVSGFSDSDFVNSGENPLIAKYDGVGNELWMQQIHTHTIYGGVSVASDTVGSAIIVGTANPSLKLEGFMTKFSSNGTIQWTQQIGNSGDDFAAAVATDLSNNVFVGGSVHNAATGADAYLNKYNSAGNLLWSRQVASAGTDEVSSVALDHAQNIYLVGYTTGNVAAPNAGAYDVFVAKFDPSGNQLWTKQFGSAGDDVPGTAAVDPAGNLIISGSISENSVGPNGAFLAEYDSSGNLLGTQQIGANQSDGFLGVATDSQGNIDATGQANTSTLALHKYP